MVLQTETLRNDVPYVARPRRHDVGEVPAVHYTLDYAEDIGGNLVPIREVVRNRNVGITGFDIASIVEPHQVLDCILHKVYVLRDFCKRWVATVNTLESVDREYLAFAMDHVAAVLRTLLDKVLGQTNS